MCNSFSFLFKGPHFAAVNQNNEIIVTDFHNHSVKVKYYLLIYCHVIFLKCAVYIMLVTFSHIVVTSFIPVQSHSKTSVFLNIDVLMQIVIKLQVFSPEGEFILKFGSNGEGNGQFNAPTGVAVDANGNIIVADWGNSRIQVTGIEQLNISQKI